MRTAVYRLILGLFGLALDIFYRRRLLAGSVPPEGPVLLVANHPNGLMDPLVVARIAGRPVCFLAKEPIFRMPVLGWLLRKVRALPVYRALDGADTESNRSTFSAVFDSLGRGDAVCLFPEGISHDAPELQRLKTGAARMALGAQAAHDGSLALTIVPVGLSYRDKTTFRSEVAVEIGTPVPVSEGDAEDRERVRALTDAIDESLRAVTLNLSRWEDLPLIELAEAIWPSDQEVDPLQRVRALAERARQLETTHPDRIAALRERIANFRARLAQLHLDPAHLGRRYPAGTVLRFVLRNLVALCVGLPAALLGTLTFFVPFYTVRVLVALLRPERTLEASYKLLGGVLLYPPYFGALLYALSRWLPPAAVVAAALVLPLAGLYASRYVDKRARAWREVRAFFTLPFRGALQRSLRAEQGALAAELDALAALPPAPLAAVER